MKEYSIASNTTPLIAFLKKNELVLLKELFNEILIPKAVYKEIIETSKDYDIEKEILEYEINNNWIKIKEVKSLKFPDLNLGKGETEAINLCLEINSPLLLIDEKKGRNVAKSFKIDVLGTLGIFALMYKNNLKNKQNLIENLDLLLKSGFYYSSDVLLNFLRELEVF